MLPFLANIITISSMARLTSANLSHQNMSMKSRITVKQIFIILKNLLKTLVGEKNLESLSTDSKVDLLNEMLSNIFWNCIPSKKIKCDYRQPPWMTDSIKRSLKERSKLTKCYYKNYQKQSDHENYLEKSSDCIKEILEAKSNYILKMTTELQDPKTAAKSYWAILSRLLYKKKIQAIPPLLVNGKFVSNFCEKANLFNNLFAQIFTPIKNSSVLPLFSYKVRARTTSFYFTEEDISLIIKKLDPAKPHGCGNISIKMIKICTESLTVLLRIILEQSLKEGRFPEIWKFSSGNQKRR